MAYTIKDYSGNVEIAVIQDATINSSATSLTLVGRDYAGYGAFLNENFVYLLQNFADASEPDNKRTGQLWYDTGNKLLQVYNETDNKWKPISSTLSQATPPSISTANVGDLWWDTTNDQLNVFSDKINDWIIIGPSYAGNSGPITTTIQDTSSNDHTVTLFYIDGSVVAIISNDSAFTPYTTINGFTTINPGLNLISSSGTAGSQFTGDSSNALALNGITAGQFLRSDQAATTAYQLSILGGAVIGTGLSLLQDSSNNEIKISSLINNYDLNFYANISGSQIKAIGINSASSTVSFNNVAVSVSGNLTSNGAFTVGGATNLQGITTLQNLLVPNLADSINIGSSSKRFNELNAVTLYGNLVAIQSNVVTATVTGNLSVNGSLQVTGNAVATQSYVISYVQDTTRNSRGTRTVTTSAPTTPGGNDGDIWYQI